MKWPHKIGTKQTIAVACNRTKWTKHGWRSQLEMGVFRWLWVLTNTWIPVLDLCEMTPGGQCPLWMQIFELARSRTWSLLLGKQTRCPLRNKPDFLPTTDHSYDENVMFLEFQSVILWQYYWIDICEMAPAGMCSLCRQKFELARIRTWNLLLRRQTRYPLRHKTNNHYATVHFYHNNVLFQVLQNESLWQWSGEKALTECCDNNTSVTPSTTTRISSALNQ